MINVSITQRTPLYSPQKSIDQLLIETHISQTLSAGYVTKISISGLLLARIILFKIISFIGEKIITTGTCKEALRRPYQMSAPDCTWHPGDTLKISTMKSFSQRDKNTTTLSYIEGNGWRQGSGENRYKCHKNNNGASWRGAPESGRSHSFCTHNICASLAETSDNTLIHKLCILGEFCRVSKHERY